MGLLHSSCMKKRYKANPIQSYYDENGERMKYEQEKKLRDYTDEKSDMVFKLLFSAYPNLDQNITFAVSVGITMTITLKYFSM